MALLVAGLMALAPLTGWAQGIVFRLTHVVVLPKAPASFDLSWADAAGRRYYLSDRTNNAVDVIDTDTNALVELIPGFAGATGRGATAGPNGLTGVPDRQELWVGDGSSLVRVIDLTNNSVAATINTGGTGRADHMTLAAGPRIMVANNNTDMPPFLSFINVDTREVLGQLAFPDIQGLEGAVWDPATGLIYQAVGASKTNAGGEVVLIDPTTRGITATWPLPDCEPHSLALGPNRQMLVGCAGGAKLHTLVLSLPGGAVAADIPQIGGADQVWYNAGDNRYYLAAYRMTANGEKGGAAAPMLGIIDAATNTHLANLPTVPGAHSLAVDANTNRAYLPLNNVGIGVYNVAGGK